MFWQMQKVVFEKQADLDETHLLGWALELGVKEREYRDCVRGWSSEQVVHDLAEAKSLRINSTPFFLIGRLQVDGGVKAVRSIRGSRPYEEFASVLDDTIQLAPSGG
jgi:predicted DsbA family dithiol-disulfide isomerase